MTNTLLFKNQIDNELSRKIRDRLKWDKRVSVADIEVFVRGCNVIVTGFVDTAYKKNAALEVVSDTEGVWSIEDRIVVPADYFRSDEEIRNILNNQVAEMIKLGGEHIEIDVIDSVVTLRGEVFRPRLKAMAVASAWELSGVRDVLNLIQILEPPRRVPLFITDKNFAAFFQESKDSDAVEDTTN
ncbi:BON domain-containing protein [Bdellovibrio sp. NC01]|uniref:BON domain-containing protein n=1 Tax=Bdellovibrio sp. NC01 TaxID=2220073 RepID=UPI001159280A|nr:BON domain-containing protein [Bdellovibrio sp. NC01]QDK39280.1 BON domain-containing protein [Bdellovibrio sp. NC01]